MDQKQYSRIKNLAEKEKFVDISYANQLIATLCNELEGKENRIDALSLQIKHRPITFPQQCYLLFSKSTDDEFYLFRTKQEAELFRLSCCNKENLYIRTIELFENHKKALLRKDYDFLRKTMA